jgi:hypothetical protein
MIKLARANSQLSLPSPVRLIYQVVDLFVKKFRQRAWLFLLFFAVSNAFDQKVVQCDERR